MVVGALVVICHPLCRGEAVQFSLGKQGRWLWITGDEVAPAVQRGDHAGRELGCQSLHGTPSGLNTS